MTATPQLSLGARILAGLKKFLLSLVGYAVDQVRQNPAAIITAVAQGAGTVATKKLSPAKATKARGVIAGIAAATIKNSVSPAVPEKSATQKALLTLAKRVGR